MYFQKDKNTTSYDLTTIAHGNIKRYLTLLQKDAQWGQHAQNAVIISTFIFFSDDTSINMCSVYVSTLHALNENFNNILVYDNEESRSGLTHCLSIRYKAI